MHILPAPDAEAYEYQMAHWSDDVRPQAIVGCAIMMAVSTFAVGIRMVSQKLYAGGWSAADWLIVSAWVISVPIAVEAIISYTYGFGLHQLRVVLSDPAPPHNLVMAFEQGSFVSFAWIPCLACIKLSLLLYYNQLFRGNQRWLKIVSWTMGVYVIAWTIASLPVLLFQCSPVPYFWERFSIMYGIKPPKGSCLPQLVHLAAPSITSTVSDFIILIIPMAILYKLQIPLKRKIALVVLFSLGVLAVAAGIVRIYFAFKVSAEDDITWNDIGTVIWTVVETNIGIFCACMPPSVPLLKAGLRAIGLKKPTSKPDPVFKDRSIPLGRPKRKVDTQEEIVRGALAPGSHSGTYYDIGRSLEENEPRNSGD